MDEPSTGVLLGRASEIREKAESIRVHVNHANATIAVRNMAVELKLRSKRAAGNIIESLSLRGGNQKAYGRGTRRRLTEFGITQNQSTRWQKLAAVPEAYYRAAVAEARAQHTLITAAFLLRFAAAQEREHTAKGRAPAARKDTVNSASRLLSNLDSLRETIAELVEHCLLFDDACMPQLAGGDAAKQRWEQRHQLKRLVCELLKALNRMRANLRQVRANQ